MTADKFTGQSSAGFHRIASFIECPQKYAYKELLGIDSAVEPKATGVGTVLHEALLAHYTRDDPESLVHQLPERYHYCIPRGMDLYYAYKRHWGDLDSFLGNVVSAEKEYVAKIGGHGFTRRLDLVVRLEDRVFIIDHKTAYDPNARAKGAELDWSLATQEIVGRAVLPSYSGLILNLIGTGSREPVFRRAPLKFSERMLDTIPRSLKWYLDQLETLKSTDPWCYPRTGNCVGRYGPCASMDLCRYGRRALANYDVREK